MVDIRENLKNAVHNSGMKQTSIAKKAHLSETQLSGILNKRRKLDVNEMFAICQVIGVTPEELMRVNQNKAG